MRFELVRVQGVPHRRSVATRTTGVRLLVSLPLALTLAVSTWAFTPSLEDRVRVFSSRGSDTLVRVEAGDWSDESTRCPTATIFRYNKLNSCYERSSSFSLKSECFPGQILLTDQAEIIVSLNSVGTQSEGKNAIVVYRSDGAIVRTWSLFDISKVAGRIQITFEPGMKWTDWSVIRAINDRGHILIRLLSDSNSAIPSSPMLRIELPSLELTSVPSPTVGPNGKMSSHTSP